MSQATESTDHDDTPQPQPTTGPQPGTHIVHVDNLESFLTSHHDKHGDYLDGRVSDAADPMGMGVRGPTPQVGEELPEQTRRHLADKVGLYKALVEKPARDVWSKGWSPATTDEDLRDELERVDRTVKVWPGLRGAKAAFRQATRLARRDGRSFVHIKLRDATTDPREEPRGVTDILQLRALPESLIDSILIEDDEAKDAHGEPRLYTLLEDPHDPSTGMSVHADRILLFVPDPGEFGSVPDGESIIDGNSHNAQGHQNISWAANEAYYQRAAPYLVVHIDKETVASEEDLKKLDEKVGELQQGSIQKIRLKGGTIETLNGSEKINDPSPFMDLHVQDAAAGSGIPKRELTGSEAGALEAAKWDDKRYHDSIVQTLQEEFASSIVLTWYERLIDWGLVDASGEILDIEWPPHQVLDEKEEAERILTLGEAALKFEQAVGQVPNEILDEFTFEDDPDAAGDASGPGIVADHEHPPEGEHPTKLPDRTILRDLAIRVSPELRELEDKFVERFRDELDAWAQTIEDRIEAVANEEVTLLDKLRPWTDAIPEQEIAQALRTLQLDPSSLTDDWISLLAEAAELGAVKQSQDLRRPTSASFVRSERWHVIQEMAEDFTASKARGLTLELHDVVGGVIEDGGGINGVRQALRERFDHLRNEAMIARTEAMRGWNQGALWAIEDAGFDRFEFVAYTDHCPVCDPFDGEVFRAGNEDAVPPLHPRCRCTLIATMREVTQT